MNMFIVILLMVISTIIGAFGSLFLKLGAEKFHLNYKKGLWNIVLDTLKNRKILLGIFLYGLSTVFFIYLLRLYELSVLYPLSALSYIFVTILSIKYLREKMNIYKWLGIAFIMLGVVLVTL